MIDLLDLIWDRKFKPYRKIIGYIFLLLSLYAFLKFQNLIFGSIFLFIATYFWGSFKRRNNLVVINNKNIPCARAEIKKLIDSSNSNIHILSRSLNPNIYMNNDIIASILEALNQRQVKLIIALNISEFIKSYKTFKDSDFIKEFIMNDNVLIYNIDKDLKKINHFLVVDSKSFRLEEIHDKDNLERKAIIVFYSDRAKELNEDFNSLITNSSISSKVDKFQLNNLLIN